MNQIHIVPGMVAIEINRALIGGVSLILCAVAPAHAEEAANRFESQLAPVAPAPAGEWWKASWREGWTYEHRGDFSLSVRAKVRNKEEVSFWQNLFGSKASEYLGELNLEARGNSLAHSGVLRNESGEILLSRVYARTDVTRAIFRDAVDDPTFVDQILDQIVDDKLRRDSFKMLMRSAFGLGGGSGGLLVGAPPQATGILGGAIGDWIGGQADDLVGAQLKKHGIQKRPDGGIEIDPNSPLLRLTEATEILAELDNFAMQLNEAFNSRMFLIRAAEKSGEELDTRQIYTEGKDLLEFAEKVENEGRSEAVEWLKSRMSSYNRPDDLVRGVLQRETFALSSKIFDAQERKPGDVWVVSGEFFNSFLHPDLPGRFRGDVVLRYVGDPEVPSRYDESVVFPAREIEVLYKGTVAGRSHQSTLEYVEPSFSARLREDTEGVLFIDKTQGYLRQADLIMESEARSNLPEIKILKGFEAVANSRFEVRYTCAGIPPE
jgi:hypothetical protein